MTRAAFIVDGIRSPFGRYGGGLAGVRADDLAAAVIAALVAKTKIPAERIDDVIGCCSISLRVVGVGLGEACGTGLADGAGRGEGGCCTGAPPCAKTSETDNSKMEGKSTKYFFMQRFERCFGSFAMTVSIVRLWMQVRCDRNLARRR